jgi:hypothetical protein
MSDETEEFIDLTVAQNPSIEDRNPDLELFEIYDINLDEEEQEE